MRALAGLLVVQISVRRGIRWRQSIGVSFIESGFIGLTSEQATPLLANHSIYRIELADGGMLPLAWDDGNTCTALFLLEGLWVAAELS